MGGAQEKKLGRGRLIPELFAGCSLVVGFHGGVVFFPPDGHGGVSAILYRGRTGRALQSCRLAAQPFSSLSEGSWFWLIDWLLSLSNWLGSLLSLSLTGAFGSWTLTSFVM